MGEEEVLPGLRHHPRSFGERVCAVCGKIGKLHGVCPPFSSSITSMARNLFEFVRELRLSGERMDDKISLVAAAERRGEKYQLRFDSVV